MKLRQTLDNEVGRIQHKVKVFDELIEGNRDSTEKSPRSWKEICVA